MEQMLFGAPSADHDHLLADCEVEEQTTKYQEPIVIGRWGTGKTAILIARARALEQELASVDPIARREWYIREQDLEADSLFELQKKFNESPNYFDSSLQKIWKLEILRRVSRIVSILKLKYADERFVNAPHWQHVNAVATKELATESFWKAIGSVVDVIFPSKDAVHAVGEFAKFFNDISSSHLFASIQRCILDLEIYNKIVPLIGIEPLETPSSHIETKIGLAESVIAALLNCYRNDFIYSDDQRIPVFITIPWNRISNRRIVHPQHIAPYTKEIHWNKSNLRMFICKRIEWEIKRAGGPKVHSRANYDAWDAIFPKYILNKTCTNPDEKHEDSFSFVCRHTLWRARDLQTITRECVLEYCSERDTQTSDFFKRQYKVDEDIVRRIVARISERNAAHRIEEARRRLAFGIDLKKHLYGAKMPLEMSQLRTKICETNEYQHFATRLDSLWESGIIGLVLEIRSPEALSNFENRFGRENDSWRRVRHRDLSAIGFLFQYNCSGAPSSLYESYSKPDSGCRPYFTVHPTFNEYLGIHLRGDYPIGC